MLVVCLLLARQSACLLPSLACLQAGRIHRITESSEQAVKVPQAALPALGAAGGLLQALGPLGDLAAGALGAPPPPPQPTALFAAAPSGGGSSNRPASGSSAGMVSSAAPGSGGGGGSGSSRGAGVRAASLPPSSGSDSSSSSSSSGSGSGSSGGGGIGALAGTWIKDAAASDLASYGRACDLLQLRGLQARAAGGDGAGGCLHHCAGGRGLLACHCRGAATATPSHPPTHLPHPSRRPRPCS